VRGSGGVLDAGGDQGLRVARHLGAAEPLQHAAQGVQVKDRGGAGVSPIAGRRRRQALDQRQDGVALDRRLRKERALEDRARMRHHDAHELRRAAVKGGGIGRPCGTREIQVGGGDRHLGVAQRRRVQQARVRQAVACDKASKARAGHAPT